MIRNLKALGLALVAVFAMSAVAASAASATSTFTTDSDNTTLTATALGNQVFTAGGSSVSCKEVSIDNTTTGTTATSITAEPTYSGDCTITVEGSTFEAKVDPEGCAYIFTAATETEKVDVHIECPLNKVLKVTAFIAGAFRECLDIHEQTPTFSTIEYHNRETADKTMDVEITANVHGITYEKTGLCKGATGNEGNDATYIGNVTVTGEDQSKPPKPVGITVS